MLQDGEENAFESVHLGIAWEDHERRLVIRDDGRMIACAGLIVAAVKAGARLRRRRLRRRDRHPHATRQGLARQVMEAAIAREASSDRSCGVLFCRADRAACTPSSASPRSTRPSTSDSSTAGALDMPLDTMWRPLAPDATWPAGPVSLPGLPF